MKSCNYNNLREYGINPLTGEACPFGVRILCDLTERGRKIVCDLLGIGYTTIPPAGVFSDNWNSGSRYSCMIPRSLFDDLYVWCLLDGGCPEVMVSSDGTVG